MTNVETDLDALIEINRKTLSEVDNPRGHFVECVTKLGTYMRFSNPDEGDRLAATEMLSCIVAYTLNLEESNTGRKE